MQRQNDIRHQPSSPVQQHRHRLLLRCLASAVYSLSGDASGATGTWTRLHGLVCRDESTIPNRRWPCITKICQRMDPKFTVPGKIVAFYRTTLCKHGICHCIDTIFGYIQYTVLKFGISGSTPYSPKFCRHHVHVQSSGLWPSLSLAYSLIFHQMFQMACNTWKADEHWTGRMETRILFYHQQRKVCRK